LTTSLIPLLAAAFVLALILREIPLHARRGLGAGQTSPLPAGGMQGRAVTSPGAPGQRT
jgi:hypothetical protein